MKPSTKLILLALMFVLLMACQVLPAPQATPSSALPVPATSTTASKAAATIPAKRPTVTLLPSPTPEPLAENGKPALKHLLALAQNIGARSPGSPQERAAAKYIQTAFEGMGYDTKIQTFAFEDEDEDELGSQNVIAVKPGLSDKTLIVGAHYDSSDEAKGADDNASGVAVILEAAELISKVETPYTIIFIAFGAEENDLDGSYYYEEQMSRTEIKNTIAMLNLDSLIAGDLAYVYGDAGPGTLRDWILAAAPQVGFKLEGKTAPELDNEDGSPCECSDYDPFQKAKIPFVYFEATDWNLGEQDGTTQVDPKLSVDGEIRHTKYDTIDAINRLFPGRIEQKLNLFVTLLTKILTDFRQL